jgi:hypothetical protein
MRCNSSGKALMMAIGFWGLTKIHVAKATLTANTTKAIFKIRLSKRIFFPASVF